MHSVSKRISNIVGSSSHALQIVSPLPEAIWELSISPLRGSAHLGTAIPPWALAHGYIPAPLTRLSRQPSLCGDHTGTVYAVITPMLFMWRSRRCCLCGDHAGAVYVRSLPRSGSVV